MARSWARGGFLFAVVGLMLGTAHAQGLPSIAVGGFVGCQDWETLKKLLEISDTGDKLAANKLLAVAGAAGECVVFREGQRAYVTDQGMLSQSLQLRLQGSVAEYWTTAPRDWRFGAPVSPIYQIVAH
jgi:hypothetical protein